MHEPTRSIWTGLVTVVILAGFRCQRMLRVRPPGVVASYVADFKAARASKGFGNDLSLADAECARGKLVQEPPPVLGRVVGYKAGFTNPALQPRFGMPAPACGVMFGKMMVESGAKLPAKFGAVPLFEGDFVAVVKNARLAEARTRLEALQHISDVAPFIEYRT